MTDQPGQSTRPSGRPIPLCHNCRAPHPDSRLRHEPIAPGSCYVWHDGAIISASANHGHPHGQ